jgi:heme O synthase-like polyprenyltransferase
MNAPTEEFEEYLEETEEKQAQQREGKRRTLYKFIYVVLFIAFFPILWYSFLLTACHQILSLFVLFLNIEYRKTEEIATQGKFNLSSVFLIVFHLILIISSVLIYFFAKENPQTGNYYF